MANQDSQGGVLGFDPDGNAVFAGKFGKSKQFWVHRLCQWRVNAEGGTAIEEAKQARECLFMAREDERNRRGTEAEVRFEKGEKHKMAMEDRRSRYQEVYERSRDLWLRRLRQRQD